MSPLRSSILGGASVLLLCFGAAAAAQTTTTTTTSTDGRTVERRVMVMHDGRGEGRWMRHDEANRGKHAAEHLRTLLQLTPQQEPALQAFLASMHPADGHGPHMDMHMPPHGADGQADPARMRADMEAFHKDMEARRAEMEKKREADMAMTTPQRLDAMVKHMAEHQAEMQAHVDAVKRFYGALTPSQQKVFDTLHRGMMGGMHHHGFGEHSGGMRGHEMQMGMMGPMPPAPPEPPFGER